LRMGKESVEKRTLFQSGQVGKRISNEGASRMGGDVILTEKKAEES